LEVTPDGIPHDEVAVMLRRSRRVAIEEDTAVAGVERSLDLDAAAIAHVARAEGGGGFEAALGAEETKH
jgi:hypothetical protein